MMCRCRLAVRPDDVNRWVSFLWLPELGEQRAHPVEAELRAATARASPASRRRHVLRLAEGGELAAVALELVALGGRRRLAGAFATKRSLASIPSPRATSLRSRSISAARLPSARARRVAPPRRRSAARRRSSSSTWTPLRRKMCAASGRASSAPAAAAKRLRLRPPRRSSRASTRRELRPDLLRHVRHHGVEQREEPLSA